MLSLYVNEIDQPVLGVYCFIDSLKIFLKYLVLNEEIKHLGLFNNSKLQLNLSIFKTEEISQLRIYGWSLELIYEHFCIEHVI